VKTDHSFYYVCVPDSKKPLFPDRCVVCGESGGELKPVQISDDLGCVQFYFYGLGGDSKEDFHLHVPMHDSCGKGVRNEFLKRVFASLAVSAAMAAFGVFLGFDSFWSLLFGFIILVALFSIVISKPVPFELNKGVGKLYLKFNIKSYAEHVAQLNAGEVTEYRQHILGNEERVGPSRDAGKE